MSEWGMLLLCAYIALGATGRLTWRQAGAAAFGLTVIVIALVMVSYSVTTPTDKYIRSIDATVYATGNPASDATPSTENLSGAQAATYSNTDHSAGATDAGSSGSGGGN
jgi:hypothetical protein